MAYNTEQIQQALLEMIRGFKGSDFIEPADEPASMTLNEDFELDSLDIINMLFQIDETYGVKISADDFPEHELLILGKLAKFISQNS